MGLGAAPFAVAAVPHRNATVLRDADLVLTMDPELGEGVLGRIEHADVLFEGGVVSAVGRGLAVPRDARVVDVGGQVVMPGIVDTHTHLWQVSIRGGCADRDVLGWLSNCSVATQPRISPADMYRFVRLATLDALQTGVTTVVDWVFSLPYAQTEQYVRALEESGLRFVYAMGGLPGREIARMKRELIDPLPLGSAHVSSFSDIGQLERLRADLRLARELGVMLNTHALEHRSQRAEKPIEALLRAGALDSDLLLNHAIHLTGHELEAIAGAGAGVAHCPLSNMRLASGIIKLPRMRELGIRTGLGHDGGTADTSDAFALMRAAVGLQRASTMDAGVYPGVEDVLRMATVGGAEAIAMDDRIGSLTPGKRADVLVLDPGTLNFAPRFDVIGQIVFNGQPGNVSYVFVEGRMLKSRGRLVNVDVAQVISDAESAATSIRGAIT
jgi:5-methylthioadenosine/S-adenosylhomocysteine deaminase